MKEYKFGFFPKKKVSVSDTTVMINRDSWDIDDLTCIYLRPFNFSKNEWGSVYFSLDSEDYPDSEPFAKNVFKFTKGQTEDVLKLLKMINLPVIQKDNNLNLTLNKQIEEPANILKCPNCDSLDVDFVKNDKKTFSVGKAAAGTLLTGGVGSLAGFAGKKGNDVWHCKDCGNVFEIKKK